MRSAALFRPFAALLALALACSVFVPPATAQSVTLGTALRAAVIRADEARLYSMLAADIGALDDILTADCLYVHSNGLVQTKPEFLAALRTGQMRYHSLRYTALPTVRLHGTETAILTATCHAEVALADGQIRKPVLLVTAVYVMKDSRWQLLSYHSTNAPAAK